MQCAERIAQHRATKQILPPTRRDDRRRRRGELDRAAVEVVRFEWPCLNGLVYVSGTGRVGQLHMREAMMLASAGQASEARLQRDWTIGRPARQALLNEAGDACGVGAG
jgi:hypothetical protein